MGVLQQSLGIHQVRTARLGERGLSQAMVLSQAPSLTGHLDWDELWHKDTLPPSLSESWLTRAVQVKPSSDGGPLGQTPG